MEKFSMDSCNIKVAIKARPLNYKEHLDGKVYWKIESDSVIHIDPLTERKNGDQFFFDRVFCDKSTNYDVFDEIVKPIIDRGVQGFNGTVFAYGQTASGKTYTMSGDESNPGIIPLAINYMFDAMNSSISREYLLRACYLEIYNEKIIDLLEKKNNKNATKKIEIQKDGLHITPLKAIVCQNAQMVIDLMKIGEKNRSIGETNMNERSSRSHTIFRIILESRNVDDDCDGAYQQSVINLVDLAGSERSSQTQSSIERFKEGCKINSSLTTLGLVIQQLSECPDSSQHINFRDSKLTRILQTSLGGNSLTAIICTVTLAVEDQTQNTLSFASRAKKIKNTAKINENVTDETLLKSYRVQLSKLNKELECIKQNQYENNEIKYKYQEEKRTNEELKERIMRLQKNMITSSLGNKDQSLYKKGYNRRRTWGGRLDSTFASNSLLETIDEDINMPRPSVPSNFGNHKEFKTPLEPFEWDLIREEECKENIISISDNIENEMSPPSSIPLTICETPKKVLRERVNNYKSMFEMSMKENNELREFTTLEKQMFYENNEQLKDLINLKKQVEDLYIEKNESAKCIEKLKCSVHLLENEKRDIGVVMEMQKNKYEKRETELLTIIEETREDLKSKEEQLKKVISTDFYMLEKQEEIKKLEMKIIELNFFNNTYIDEIEVLKSQLNNEQALKVELSKNCSLLNEFCNLQNHVSEVKSIPFAIKFLADKGYCTFRKHEIKKLDQLLKQSHSIVEQLQNENQSLIDENNNLKLNTIDIINQLNNIKRENDKLRLELDNIEINIKSIIKDFSASSVIDVDNSNTNSLISFAVKYFEQNTNDIEELSKKNLILKEKLSLWDNKLCEIKLCVFDNLDCILQSISTVVVDSNIEVEKYKKNISETIEENVFFKSSIQALNKLTFECTDIIKQLKINMLNNTNLQEELILCDIVKNDFQVQIQELNVLNDNLKMLIDNQTKVERNIQEELDNKDLKLKNTLVKLDEMQLIVKDNEIKMNSNTDLEEKLKAELENAKLELSIKCNELEKYNLSYTKNINQKEKIENQLKDELVVKTKDLQNSLDELKELKIELDLKESVIEKLNVEINSLKSELDEKTKLVTDMENIKLKFAENQNNLEEINRLSSINAELKIKLEDKEMYENEIQKELLVKTKNLEDTLLQVNDLHLTIKEMQINTDSYVTIINKVNSELDNIKSELEEKANVEKVLRNELQIVNRELEDAIVQVNEVKSVIDHLNIKCESLNYSVEKLNNELERIEIVLNEKNNLIMDLENACIELQLKCNSSEVTDKLNKTIMDLKIELKDKIKAKDEIHNELLIKTLQLENYLAKENEIQTLVESMENEIKLNIVSIEQLKAELTSKSNLLIELENIKSSEMKESKLINIENNEYFKTIQDQLQAVIQEKIIIQEDFNLINQKFLKITKDYDETKIYLKNSLQQKALNYQQLLKEFLNLSCDIESFLILQLNMKSSLKEDILSNSNEFNYLQKQLHESSLQQDYEKLEEEYILRTREYDEARTKIENLELILTTKEESEKVLKNKFKSKCLALEEYKKNVEFLFMKNDSFQIRVNDFEENVLVNLNEEFDSMKSELEKRSENEKILLKEKLELECHLNELQEQLLNLSKTLELSDERSEELASVVSVLVIEINDANFAKENLEYRLNEAEWELLKTEDLVENLKYEIYTVQRELENTHIKTEFMKNELDNLKTNFIDKMNKNDMESCNVGNQLIDPLVDYVHDIKLKLTELNSAMISGNQSEKQFRTKVMSVEDEILPLDETQKVNYDLLLESPNIGIDEETNNLRKILEDTTSLADKLKQDRNNLEKNISEIQDQMKIVSNENRQLIDAMRLMEIELKEKTLLVSNLTDELNQVKKQCIELEEHNQATKEQIHYSFDIDSELRNGKKNLVNEINLLEPGKITGILTHHNLSNLLDTFVNLIMTKEQQIVTDFVNDHSKVKQQYEDQIKQFEEDIKKGKEWQEQVETDNEKLCLELENLKSQKLNFPSREIEFKELTEKLLEAENQSFNYLSELQELKTQFSTTSEQNYQALSNEFEMFKTSSEQSIQDLKKKLEDLTDKYNESLSMYKDQKNSRSTLECQIEKIKSECDSLKTIIEKKDEDIKNLIDEVQSKKNEYEILIEKHSLYKEEMKNKLEKKVDELQLELNEKTQKIYCTEKLLKEVTKNYNQLIEENSSNLIEIKHLRTNDNSNVRVSELEHDIQVVTSTSERLKSELQIKCSTLEETKDQCSKLIQDLEVYKLKISEFEKQLESCYETIKLKDNQIENYQIKSETNYDDLVKVNNITKKLKEILKCDDALPILYENISSLMAKCTFLEEEIEELKHININLDKECESMLIEIKCKDNRIIEILTQEDQLNKNITLLTEENYFLKNKYEQFKNINDELKKLNNEICDYEQTISKFRKEKGQLIVQHDKELKQMKIELNEVHAKNLELLNDYNKLSETAKNLEKSLKEDIQQLNRCIVDKNAKISTLELFSKTNTDELKKRNHELEHIFKKARDENHMLRKELRRLKEVTNVRKIDQYTQTVEELNVLSNTMTVGHKNMAEKITKLENDNHVMKKILHLRKVKIEELQRELNERLN